MTRALRVLLIDDNATERLLAEEAFALTDDLICTLTMASSGPEALARLRSPEAVLPDVILLDINMPVMGGFEVLSALKDDPKLLLLPVVMFSTSHAEADVTQAYTLQASAYLLKSPDFPLFLKQVETFILFWSGAHLPHRSKRTTR
ncbi:response regulator [Deinococcus aquatilis]|uniref:response regulator n=1 Tax=Deinococcus aquatilis TaxID=519440 RepID=UPI00037DE4AE|nr:response regulator [Deinococcus aquatilis]